jgi:esterase/lipase superfamily enzyme
VPETPLAEPQTMTRDYHRWYSRSLDREMELLVFGHGGPPVVVFPSSMGAFFEYEDRGMVEAVRQKLDHGWLQLYCVSSVDSESWYARGRHPRQRLDRHLQYESYILGDVVPLIRHLNPVPGIGLSGAFDIRQFLDGWSDTDAYLLNPLSFLPGLDDPYYLEQYRRNKFVLSTGEWDICRAANEDFSRMLAAKGLPHSLHVWGFGSKHDWPFWLPMASAYLP